MQFLQVLLTIVVFIIGLSLIICLHELGHLLFAKLFNVYCFEYSIGFGPKILSVKKLKQKKASKNKENAFEAPVESHEELKEKLKNLDNNLTSSSFSNIDSLKDNEKNTSINVVDVSEEIDNKNDSDIQNNKDSQANDETENNQIKYLDKQKGETDFCIRAIPLGGFVSMAGEDGDTLDGSEYKIPPSRCLPNINRGKQVIVLLAGITVNIILSIILFFIANLCPYQVSVFDSPVVSVQKDSVASQIGLESGDKLLYLYQEYNLIKNDGSNETDSAFFPYGNEETNNRFPKSNQVVAANDDDINYFESIKMDGEVSYKLLTYQSFPKGLTEVQSYNNMNKNCVSYCACNVINYVNEKVEDGKSLLDLPTGFEKFATESNGNYAFDITSNCKRTFRFLFEDSNKNLKKGTAILNATQASLNSPYTLDSLFGISNTTRSEHYSFGTAFVKSFTDFGNVFVEMFKALGSLFTADGWKNVGGIISIYRVTSQVTQMGQASMVFRLWGMLSLNVAIFNLFPFPGLDGFQTLIVIIEAIRRKKISAKVKGIMNTVGMIIMFVLAGLLIIKDIVVPV